MIPVDRHFMAWLRQQHRSLDVANFVHLSLLGPGWYRQTDLADEFNQCRSNIGQSMLRLRKQGLIQYLSYGAGGTYIWWIRQGVTDQPNPKTQWPRWVVRCRKNNSMSTNLEEILVGQQKRWAARHHISPGTLRNFLGGHSKLLLGRYELVSTPFLGKPGEMEALE
jgi:hypothetical protein